MRKGLAEPTDDELEATSLGNLVKQLNIRLWSSWSRIVALVSEKLCSKYSRLVPAWSSTSKSMMMFRILFVSVHLWSDKWKRRS